MVVYPQLEFLDEIVRLLGWPALLAGLVWVIRKWDKGQREFKDIAENTKIAVQGVSEVKSQVAVIQNNHLAHLQAGITQVAASNDKAVDLLQNISSDIRVLVDRTPRV